MKRGQPSGKMELNDCEFKSCESADVLFLSVSRVDLMVGLLFKEMRLQVP